MLSSPIISDVFTYISSLPLGLKILDLLLCFIVGPFCGIPMMIIITFTIFLTGLIPGIPIAFLGYILSVLFYFQVSKKLRKLSFVKKNLEKIKGRVKILRQEKSFLALISYSLFIPFLPLVLLLGLTHENPFKICAGLFIGFMPAFIISIQAGYLGNFSLHKGFSKEQMILSLGVVFIAFLTRFILNKVVRKNVKN